MSIQERTWRINVTGQKYHLKIVYGSGMNDTKEMKSDSVEVLDSTWMNSEERE